MSAAPQGAARAIRTPDARFAGLPGFPYTPRYVEVAGPGGGRLRMHYLDEGPRAATPVLLLHGEPTWSYLYRKLIPILSAAGLRAIAPDHIGFGRSDKLIEKTQYSFERHIEWLRELVLALDLREITLVGQDWGGPIGLALLARETARFARAVAANTILHTAEPELAGRLGWSLHGTGAADVQVNESLLDWIAQSQRAPELVASAAIRGACAKGLAPEIAAAYDAPFPDERYKAGMRQFPILIPVTRSDPGAAIDRATWDALRRFHKPFLTLYSDGDPATAGWDAIFQERVPGARGQAHATLRGAGHFLQEDCGEDLARLISEFAQRGSPPRQAG